MANQEHLDRLRREIDGWNEWRNQHPEIQPDLSNADLSGADLSFADLSRANLHRANLSNANLSKVKLFRADLGFANLSNANLFNADISQTHLHDAIISRANLCEAVIDGASLHNANLSNANLIRANLAQARLTVTDLSSADLTGANLTLTNFNFTKLDGATLHGATTFLTIFADVDLSTVKGLTSINHEARSIIGIETIYRSQGKIPESFLRDAGVPDSFLEYMHSLVGQAIQYFTCFISHSHHDQRFCDRLYADLRHHDVPSWYFPEDATWGKSVWGEIDRSIKIYDKLVVVCSEHSLQSPAVQREMERAIQREDREGKHILFPLRLDNYLFEQWEHERKADVVSKVAGDFRGWESSAEQYDRAFQRFLKALKAE